MKTPYQIERMADGTYTSRIVSPNGKLTFSNHQADTKQGAYRNLAANIKLMAKSIVVTVLSVTKVKGKNKLIVTKWIEGKERMAEVEVKEINC
jgi:hypothetical protein